MGVSILQRGDRLSLQATLPPKPGKDKPARQIALGIYANEWGLAEAEALAFQLGAELARGQFRWENWLNREGKEEGDQCGALVERYRQFIWDSRLEGADEVKRVLWRKRFYNPALKWLPMEKPLSEEVILIAVLHYFPNTRSRQLACQILQAFAEWAGMSCDLKPYIGGYSVKDVKREIPTDAEILEGVAKIPNPQWRWVAMVMATYGLRDHECWFVNLKREHDPLLGEVLIAHVSDGKTGERSVRPLHPEWVGRWKLSDDVPPLPSVTVRTFDEYGDRTSMMFRRYKVGFTPYSLRHAYAIRGSVAYRIPTPVMADMMGHDPEVHLRTYNRHISEEQKRQAYRNAVAAKNL